MSSTNRAGIGATALELLQELVQAAARRLREHVQPFLEGVLDQLERIRERSARQVKVVSARAQRQIAPPAAPSDGGRPASPGIAAHGDALPRAYGQRRAVLVARDPWWLFAHWEVPPVARVEALRTLGPEAEGAREVLRVYTADSESPAWWDVELEPGAERSEIRIERPARSYRVEIGVRTGAGRFVPLVTSNVVSPPPAEPSPDTSVHWVRLEADGRMTEEAAEWSGHRVVTPSTATVLGPADDTPAADDVFEPASGSSEAMPPRARSSDALPLR